jgi:putative drug exporter of the RND superfamily
VSHQPQPHHSPGFFAALGDFVARFRWLVLAVWIIFVGVSVLGARQVKGELVSGGINVPGSESNRGEQILADEFDRRPTRTAAAIFTSTKFKVTDPQYRAGVEQALDRVRGVEGVDRILSFYTTGLERLKSKDETTTYAVINLAGDEEEAKALIPKIRDELHRDLSADIDEAYIIGFPAVSYDISQGSAEDLHHAELSSLPLTLFLLLMVFGTIVASGLPVMLGAAAVVTALGLLYLVALRMETSIFAMNTASMIGLGLGIDFSLLMVSRYREELARGRTPHRATVRTVETAGKSIVFSGLTVMLGLSVMLLYDLVLVRSIALGMLLVAGLAVLGAVTLLPALMCLFGRQVNSFNLIPWSKPGAQQQAGTGKWHAWSLLVMRYPWPFLFLSVGLLLAMSWPAKDMNAIGAGGPQGVGEEAESRKGFEVLSRAFPVGEVAPISIIIKTNKTDGVFDPVNREGVFRLTQQLAEEADRVARVESVANLNPSLTLEQFKAITPEQLVGADPRQRALIAQYVNIDRNRDIYHVVVISNFAEVAPETTDLVKDIRTKIVPGIRELRNAEVMVTGQSALTLDYRDELFGQFPLLVGMVLLVTYFVLLLFFHSLILPLKAILMNLIGITASYGFLVMVFEWGILDSILGFEHLGRLTMFPPVILFSILFGLSTDYEVFLLSRVKEIYERDKARLDAQYGPNAVHDAEYNRKLDEINEHSVAEGLEKTAGIITAAGLIMIVVFGAFALGHVLVVKELGIGLAMAVLLDSTIIRVIMVPVSMKLMGHLNWWMPKALDWIPHIREGGDEEEDEVVAGRPAPGQARFCGRCGAVLPARARFCGRCGRVLSSPRDYPQPVAVGAGVAAAYGGETVMGGAIGQPRQDWGRQAAGQAMMPPAAMGLHRIPIVLRIGRNEHRAWLNLRDCQIEKDPNLPNVPVVAIDGLDVYPMPGQDPPEIQIRNARIRY